MPTPIELLRKVEQCPSSIRVQIALPRDLVDEIKKFREEESLEDGYEMVNSIYWQLAESDHFYGSLPEVIITVSASGFEQLRKFVTEYRMNHKD